MSLEKIQFYPLHFPDADKNVSLCKIDVNSFTQQQQQN
jgi:predicted small lipoprotein YifL